MDEELDQTGGWGNSHQDRVSRPGKDRTQPRPRPSGEVDLEEPD